MKRVLKIISSLFTRIKEFIMPIFKGSSKQNEVYIGGTKIGKVYKGGTLVYQNGFKLLGTTLNQYDNMRRFYLLKDWDANSLIFVDELTIPNTIQSIQGTIGAAGSKIQRQETRQEI